MTAFVSSTGTHGPLDVTVLRRAVVVPPTWYVCRESPYLSCSKTQQARRVCARQGQCMQKQDQGQAEMDTKPEKKENERKDYRKRNSLVFSVMDFVKVQHDTEEVRARALATRPTLRPPPRRPPP